MSTVILSLSLVRMTVSWSTYHCFCRLCKIEERIAELQNLTQNHAEDGSRNSHDVERDSTLASIIAMPLVQAFSSG